MAITKREQFQILTILHTIPKHDRTPEGFTDEVNTAYKEKHGRGKTYSYSQIANIAKIAGIKIPERNRRQSPVELLWGKVQKLEEQNRILATAVLHLSANLHMTDHRHIVDDPETLVENLAKIKTELKD